MQVGRSPARPYGICLRDKEGEGRGKRRTRGKRRRGKEEGEEVVGTEAP
jgi:hypothetical protein